MTFADPNSLVERARSVISRVGLGVASGLLAIGLVLSGIDRPAGSVTALQSACAILLVIPVVNAVAALLEEVGRREWPFVAAALLVIGLVAYSVLERVK